MNKKALLHKSDSKYCFATSKNTLVLRLQVDKNDDLEAVEVIYESKYTIHEGQKRAVMSVKYEDHLYHYYEVELSLDDVRLSYVFCLWEQGKAYYFSEDGITESYNFTLSYYNSFQMPYIHESDLHTVVPWMENSVFYEIFIDRFCMGNHEKDQSYINLVWGDIPTPKSFAGGDLEGIIHKLDYIKGLGANGLYLTPVFRAVSNHKYDIHDYYNIDPHFGSNEVFRILVKEAHARGMKVVLDAVFNHCSMLLPQFQDVLHHGKESPYYEWFIIDGDYPDLDQLNYEVFAFCNYMPKFNSNHPEVKKYLLDIATYWIKEYDIDGWRLDVSDEISHDFWRKFRKTVKKIKADCVIIGENWHDANAYLMGDQYDSIMNYAFTKACLDYFAYNQFKVEDFAYKLNHLLTRNTNQVNTMMLNLLDSHDTDRFYSCVGRSKDKLLSAIAVMTIFPGVPCLYYGTEIPLEGGYDPDNRRCFEWDENRWDHKFTSNIKKIFALKQEDVLRKGEVEIFAENDLCYIKRSYEGKELCLILNQSNADKVISINGDIVLSNGLEEDVLSHNGFIIMTSE